MKILLSKESLKVLTTVRKRPADGYTVMSSTGINAVQLLTVLEELSSERLVDVKGNLSAPVIGEAYVFVPPRAKARADFLIASGSM